jgi:hypothetical protein
VLPLRGCLGALPEQLRLALELGSGVGAARAFSPAEVAQLLRVEVARVEPLQREGLGQLRARARASGCSAQAASLADPLGGFAFAPADGEAASWLAPRAAEGGVAGAQEANAPASAHRGRGGDRGGSGGQDLLGLELPPEAGQALLVALIAAAAMLLLALLFANELQPVSRWRAWLWRLRHRPPV